MKTLLAILPMIVSASVAYGQQFEMPRDPMVQHVNQIPAFRPTPPPAQPVEMVEHAVGEDNVIDPTIRKIPAPHPLAEVNPELFGGRATQVAQPQPVQQPSGQVIIATPIPSYKTTQYNDSTAEAKPVLGPHTRILAEQNQAIQKDVGGLLADAPQAGSGVAYLPDANGNRVINLKPRTQIPTTVFKEMARSHACDVPKIGSCLVYVGGKVHVYGVRRGDDAHADIMEYEVDQSQPGIAAMTKHLQTDLKLSKNKHLVRIYSRSGANVVANAKQLNTNQAGTQQGSTQAKAASQTQTTIPQARATGRPVNLLQHYDTTASVQ